MRFESQADGMPSSVVTENSLGGRPQPIKDHLARRSPADRRDVSTVVPRTGPSDAEDALREAQRLAEEATWLGVSRNNGWLLAMADLLEQHQAELADFGARELGQVRRELIADALGASIALRWLHAAATLETRLCFDESQGIEQFAHRHGVSVALINCACAIDPASSALTRVAAALARGCTAVLRPRPESAGTTALLVDLLRQAGAPLHRLVLVHGDLETEQYVLQGSRARGWVILGETADIPSHLPRRPNPAVVLADADLRQAVPAITMMALRASGQGDDACHHVIVDRRVAGAVREELTRYLGTTVPGDPRAPETAMGPMLSEPMLHAWNELRGLGIGEGAELLVDGARSEAAVSDRVSSHGSVALNATPRLFARVTRSMLLCKSTSRGPTLLILETDGIDEALDVTRGLGCIEGLSLFSRDARVLSVFRGHLRAAAVLLNPSASPGAVARRWARLAVLDAWEHCAQWQLVVPDSGTQASSADTDSIGAEPRAALAWPELRG